MIGAWVYAAVSPAPSTASKRSGRSSGSGNTPFCGPESTKSADTSLEATSSTERFIDAPSMPITVTSAMPSISANAVVAVRRGLRRVFVDASLPTAPNGSPITRPSGGTTGRLSAGPARNRPVIAASAATPTRPARRPVAPSSQPIAYTAAATPATTRTRPAMVRQRSGCGVAASLERIASTGLTCPALRAGASADNTVTSVPTTSGTTTARVDKPVPASGSGMP